MTTVWRMPEPGDVVTRYAGAAHFQVIEVDEPRNPVAFTRVRMRSLRSGHRFSEQIGWLHWVEEDGSTGDPIVPNSVRDAPTTDRQGEKAVAWMMCRTCGAAVRSDTPGILWYWCAGCGRTSEHLAVGVTDDKAERDNEKRRVLLRQLRATEDLLDQLGIRLRRKKGMDRAARVHVERGRGATHRFIYLADDLTVAEQVEYLGYAWRYLAPVNDERWTEDTWRVDEDDPQIQWKGLEWKRPETHEEARR